VPRRPRARGELTLAQQKIVEAALTMFADQGFHATATKEIAKRAGRTRPRATRSRRSAS
jgi:AcrR family transcriptional regulator